LIRLPSLFVSSLRRAAFLLFFLSYFFFKQTKSAALGLRRSSDDALFPTDRANDELQTVDRGQSAALKIDN